MISSEISYSVVVPVFNSSHSLVELRDRIDAVFKNEMKETYELIFIDDGSESELTWPFLNGLSKKYKEVTSIRLMRNFGKQGALLCGFSNAKGRYIITIDDDLQHFPEDIPSLAALNAHDVVIGRFENKEHNLSKRIFSRVNNWFETKLLGKPEHITNSPFKLIRAEVVNSFLQIKTPNPSLSALLFFVTKDVKNVSVRHAKRPYGKSGFTLKKMFETFASMLFNNSSFLLKLIAYAGISISFFSFLLALIYFIKKLTVGIPVPGYASLVTVTLFIGGLMLFSIGIVGEYLIRIINGVELKPAYVVREKSEG
ncbi:MAG: glycosyltransferase family 2 protein [Sporocytophaga sp.]|nr:glycosyltransferase family 2 protein [Sporocytophaga sp.]